MTVSIAQIQTAGKATAASPTHVEGTQQAVSFDLEGRARVVNTAISATGVIDAIAETITLVSDTSDSVKIQITGTWSGTLNIEQSVDGSTYIPYGAIALPLSLGLPTSSVVTTNGTFVLNGSSTKFIRIRASTWASGSATVTINGSSGTSLLIANVVDDGVVLTSNSTTTPLGGGQVFTGTGVDILPFTAISILSYADQAGTLSVQFSPDNIFWDSQVAFAKAIVFFASR
jgi:hypothetical protein